MSKIYWCWAPNEGETRATATKWPGKSPAEAAELSAADWAEQGSNLAEDRVIIAVAEEAEDSNAQRFNVSIKRVYTAIEIIQ